VRTGDRPDDCGMTNLPDEEPSHVVDPGPGDPRRLHPPTEAGDHRTPDRGDGRGRGRADAPVHLVRAAGGLQRRLGNWRPRGVRRRRQGTRTGCTDPARVRAVPPPGRLLVLATFSGYVVAAQATATALHAGPAAQ